MASVKKEYKAYIGLTLGTLITGLSVMFVIIALRSANTSDLLAHRFSVGTLGMLVAYSFGKVKFPKFTFKQMLPLLILSIPYPILFFTLQTEGLKHTTASQAGIILAMMPILTVIVASIFLKEKTNSKQIISILLSVSGIVFILLKTGLAGGNNNLKGNLLILFSLISVVTYYTLARKINKNYNTLDISFFMTLTACVVFNSIAIFGHIKVGTIAQFYEPFKETSFLWSILYLGILSFIFTSFFSNYALATIPASQVAIFNNLSPIITIFSGVLILNETLYNFHTIGGLMVIAGVTGTLFFKEKHTPN